MPSLLTRHGHCAGYALFVLLTAFGAVGHATIPATVPLQAVVQTASGAPVTTSTSVTFSLYNAPNGGTALWAETQTVTPSSTGLISVQLGSSHPLSDVLFNQPYYVGVKVGSDAEMTPRLPLASVPYALSALSVPYSGITGTPSSLPPSGPAGGGLTGSYPNPAIAPNAVDNSKLARDIASLGKLTGGILSVSATGDAVDQQQTIATAHLGAIYGNYQSFTAGLSGFLSAIELYFSGGNAGGTASLSIYRHSVHGPLVSFQNIAVAPGDGWQKFPLPTPIAIEVGEELVWMLNGPETMALGITDGNPYPGGMGNYAGGGYDFAFRTYVITTNATLHGDLSLTEGLTVAGAAKMTGFQLVASPAAGRVLTSDASGNGTWQVAPPPILAGDINGTDLHINNGTGFAVSRMQGRPIGGYHITFTTPFAAAPVVTATANAEADGLSATFSNPTIGGVDVLITTANNGFRDVRFSFIAIGVR